MSQTSLIARLRSTPSALASRLRNAHFGGRPKPVDEATQLAAERRLERYCADVRTQQREDLG